MNRTDLPLSVGRIAFGGDPDGYARGRPPYPASVFEEMEKDRALSGAAIVEIGAGTGLATESLLRRGPARLLAIEPDARLAAYLRRGLSAHHSELAVSDASFEEADFAPESADLIVSATAFHWLDQPSALAKAMHVLKPGGCFAMFWNVFHDREQPDALHEASAPLWRLLPSSRSFQTPALPFALDAAGRLDDLRAAGFTPVRSWFGRWQTEMETEAVLALTATFSQVTQAEPALRERFLGELEELMRTRFGGRVERRFTTALYLGRKPGV